MAVKATQQKKKTPAEVLRERKITAYQEQITQNQERLAVLSAEKAQMSEISTLGLSVHHKLFGGGRVTEQDGNTITVAFPCGNKRFLMPASLIHGFLETDEPGIQEGIARYLDIESQIAEVKNQISQIHHAIRSLVR